MTTTPDPPYQAVVFTSRRAAGGDRDYIDAADRMEALAATIPGYLGIESARDENGVGITVSYWRDQESIARWREHPEHLEVQGRGRADWYEWYELRVATVEKTRSFP